MNKCTACNGRGQTHYQRAHPMQSGDTHSPMTHYSIQCSSCRGSGWEPIRAYCTCNGHQKQITATVKLEHCSIEIDGIKVEYDAMIPRCVLCGEHACTGTLESTELSDAETKTAHAAYKKALDSVKEAQ